ncbi:MAG: hypothetical protein NW218_14255 [Saprospiraceae bacterium]|nr:hypothetical protein [Saprospiraceae bacterium]
MNTMYFRNLIPTILAILAISPCSPLQAQNTDPDAHFHPIRIGFGPISALTLIGKFNVCAEWVYKPNRSIGLLVSVPVNNVPSYLGYTDKNSRQITTKHYLTVLNIILEQKRYLNKSAPVDFYWAPYLRYSEYHAWKRDSVASTQSNYLYSNQLKGLGIGGAGGIQFTLGHRFTVDFTFLAFDLKLMRGYQRYETDYNDPNYGKVLISEAGRYWSELPVFHFNVIENNLQGNSLRTRTNLKVIPGYRANITIKLAFGKSVPLAAN